MSWFEEVSFYGNVLVGSEQLNSRLSSLGCSGSNHLGRMRQSVSVRRWCKHWWNIPPSVPNGMFVRKPRSSMGHCPLPRPLLLLMMYVIITFNPSFLNCCRPLFTTRGKEASCLPSHRHAHEKVSYLIRWGSGDSAAVRAPDL